MLVSKILPMTRIMQLYFLCALLVFAACKSRNKTSPKNVKNEEFPSEMVDFVPSKGNPVFKGTGTATWDQKIRERGYILYEDSLYKMWYSGYNPELARQKFMGYATSKDGVTWTKYSDKPIFSDRWAEDMFVVKNEGNYYMYAEGDKDVAHFLVSPDGIKVCLK